MRRIATTVLIVLIALFAQIGIASAAPSMPSDYRQIGDTQRWTSNYIQHTHRNEGHAFTTPAGTQWASVKITWHSTTNNGKNNESSHVTTPLGQADCLDGDLKSATNADYICFEAEGPFTADTFEVFITYIGDGLVGDSHELKVEVNFFGPPSTSTSTYDRHNNDHPGNGCCDNPWTDDNWTPPNIPGAGEDEGFNPFQFSFTSSFLPPQFSSAIDGMIYGILAVLIGMIPVSIGFRIRAYKYGY
jgi:hypothetical protein